jgi:hypothetical protein
MIPPGSIVRAAHPVVSRIGRGFVCRFARFRFSTITLAVTRARLEDPSLLAAVLAGEHLDESPFLIRIVVPSLEHLGARLTIFMKFFSRSSRATGPKMRVPRGFSWLSMMTAAFSSKPINVPSPLP